MITGTHSLPAARFAVLVHGGAGDVPEASRASHREGAEIAARAAREILAAGGTAMDAVVRAVEILEDDPRYNAGTGGSLDEDGRLFLDAAVMDGATLRAGGVMALPPFRHPIAIARAAMEDGRHVLYAGEGAARFAEARGFVRAGDEMITAKARERLAKTRAGEGGNWAGGTVGAVARDVHGHVACATSTGGTVGKRFGRVGDTPVLGAGSYADDRAGAVSGTGEGEGYLRAVIAARCAAWMEGGESAVDAAARGIAWLEERTSAKGGLILVSARGDLGLARSTATMTWAAATDRDDVLSGS